MELNTQTTAINTAYSSRKNSEHNALYSTNKNRNRTMSLNTESLKGPIPKTTLNPVNNNLLNDHQATLL